jgi:hypothetical protein
LASSLKEKLTIAAIEDDRCFDDAYPMTTEGSNRLRNVINSA